MNLLCVLIGHKWIYNKFMGKSKMSGIPYEFTDQRKCLRCPKHQYTIFPLRCDSWKDVKTPINNTIFIEMGLKEYWEK